MVFAIGLAVVTAIAPPAAVVTQPMLAQMGGGVATAMTGKAVAGLAVTGTSAAVGAATGASTVGSTVIGVSAGVTGGLVTGVNLAMGPPGWIALGASEYDWTCWKKIVHDYSDNNDAVPLSYIFNHTSVKATVNHENYLIVENIWGEKFNINFVRLPNGDIAAHAE